jgi:hypothetical protein
MPILGHIPRDGAMSRDGAFTSAATSGNRSGSGVFPSISGGAPGPAGRGAAPAGARLVPPEHARASANTTEAPAIAWD